MKRNTRTANFPMFITEDQIRALRVEAAAHGDTATVTTCDVALGNGVETTVENVRNARLVIAKILDDASAMKEGK